MLHGHTVATNNYNLLMSKEMLEENFAQLIALARQHTKLNTPGKATCEPEINQLIDTARNLHTYIENFNEHIAQTTKEELYKFQNQIHQNNINEVFHGLCHAFTKKEENSSTRTVNKEAWSTLNSIKTIYTDAKNHLLHLLTNTIKDRKINEFDLFQQMEAEAISEIKPHVIAGHDLHSIDDATKRFREALEMIPNIYNQKKLVFLWAALLKDGVDYAKIYKVGLQQMPSPVGYVDIGRPSAEEMTRRKDREQKRRAIEDEMQAYLNYLPLLIYHICDYDNMQATIDTLRSNDQYASIIKRIELHSVLGDYIFTYNKFNRLRVAYGDGKRHHGNYNEQEDIAWLTVWRDKELHLMGQQAAAFPELLEKINTLKNNQIKVEYLGACVLVNGLGDIGAVMLALNEYEIKKLALAKASVSHLSLFTTALMAPGASIPPKTSQGIAAPYFNS